MTTQMTLFEPSKYAVMTMDAGEVQEVIRDNLGGGNLSAWDLDRIKVPAGGVTIWTIPGIQGETNERAIDGVIVDSRTIRSYWKEAFSGAGTPPDCASKDGIIGIGMYGRGSEANGDGYCEICPMAQFGTDPKGNGGQACKQARLLFLVRPTGILPVVISVPPSSLKNLKRYMIGLASAGHHYTSVVTRFELAKTRNSGGIEYGEIKPSMVGELNETERAQFRTYGESLKSVLAGVSLPVEAFD
jgi:hypothetical protein